MSEHRRKLSPPQDGGRAAARRAAQQPSGRRAAPTRDTTSTTEAPSDAYGEERQYSGRAEARRAAQRGAAGGSRRRGAEAGSAAAAGRSGRGRGGPPAEDKFINYPRSDKYGWRRFVPSWRLVSGTCLGFFAIMVAGAGVAFAWVDTPDAQKMANAQNNVFYWDNGTQLAATGGQRNRQIVSIHEIPKSMQDAVIAAENASFDDDWGVDPVGIGRAVFKMATGGETQGGSTITQQYVKNTFLEQDQTMKRKFTELFISIKVGATEKKDKILEGYLNTAYFGRGAYGIQAASQAYFGKNSEKLDADESAFLAQLLKGPNLYNPDGGIGDNASAEKNLARAKERWSWVLDRQVEVGRMEPAERQKYKEFPELEDSGQASGLDGQKGYLVETAKKYVMKKHPEISVEDLDRGGYRIYTTFDRAKVDAMEKAVNKTRKAFLNVKERPEKDKFVQFGSASVDVKTGKIVAIYGGEGWDKKHFTNNADTSGVPVGSTWKPYVLAAAMEHGTPNSGPQGLSPMSKYNGNDMIEIKYPSGNPVPGKNGQPFRQKNESDKAYGYVTLREAMEKSINSPFVQLGIDVGLSKVAKMAKDTGILEESMDQQNASFSLGTSTPSAIRMADSYATFADSGTQHEPYSVSRVSYDGKDLDGFEEPAEKTVMDDNIADNITDVLRNVVESDEGTGKKAQKLERPVAGKTGTTDKNKSAWFVGYTPQLSTSVTMFRTDPESRKLLSMNGTGGVPSIHGGDIPTEVWTNYMREALKDEKVEDFPEPGPVGKKADSAGAPSPTPTPQPSETPSETPSATPSETASETPQPSETPSEEASCDPFDWACEDGKDNGGNGNGGTDAGGTDAGGTDTGGTTTDGGTTDGGTTDGTTTDGSTTDGGTTDGKPGNGNDGGLFGGSG